MMDVIAFGEALIDMRAATVEGKTAFYPQPGGAPANVAVGVAKLGGNARFVGQVGDDMFGRQIRQALASYGVGTDQLVHTKTAMTALAFISIADDGERSFAFYRDRSADLLYRPEQCPNKVLTNGSIFHSCSNTLTEPDIRATSLALIERARAGGCLVSFDVNYRHNLWPTGQRPQQPIWQALTAAHIVKFSREELNDLYSDTLDNTPGDTPDIIPGMLEAGVRLVLITDGAEPITAHWPRGKLSFTPPTTTAIDTTAAGDAFVAGFLFHLARAECTPQTLAEWLSRPDLLKDALAFASRCGAVTVERFGALEAMPGVGEV